MCQNCYKDIIYLYAWIVICDYFRELVEIMCACLNYIHRCIKLLIKFWHTSNFQKNTFGHGSICRG